MTAAVAARAAGAETIGVNAEDGSRTDDGFLLEFALAAKEAGASRVRYCDTIGGETPGRIRERFAKLASAAGLPVETHCHNDLGLAVANSLAGALGDLDAGRDAWINTCVNGIGWARRLALWASYAFGQPLPRPGPVPEGTRSPTSRASTPTVRFKDRANYELYDDSVLGPFPHDWYAREGRVILTGEYGGKAGFRHVLDGLGIEVTPGEEDLVFSLVQLCAAATGKPLTDDEIRLIAGYPHQLALLYPGALRV
jgi:isopropylmalate/homocitrate/citramalate synthase